MIFPLHNSLKFTAYDTTSKFGPVGMTPEVDLDPLRCTPPLNKILDLPLLSANTNSIVCFPTCVYKWGKSN